MAVAVLFGVAGLNEALEGYDLGPSWWVMNDDQKNAVFGAIRGQAGLVLVQNADGTWSWFGGGDRVDLTKWHSWLLELLARWVRFQSLAGPDGFFDVSGYRSVRDLRPGTAHRPPIALR